jgi:hypothetical protein
MKRKLFSLRFAILVLLTGIALSSCKKDSTTTDDVVGTWTSGAITLDVMVGTKTLTQYYIDEMGYTAEEAAAATALAEEFIKAFFTGTVTVKEDHTYTSNLGGIAETGTWSLSTDRTELTLDSSTDDPVIYDVVELTSSILKLHVAGTDSADLNGDSIDEILNIQADFTFNK